MGSRCTISRSTVFAVIIGELFFNVGGSAAGLLLSLATFGVGFVMRPLGAVLIGNYADKHGRKAALTLTIALMTIGTGMIALTPTYESIGIAATVMLVVGRLLQGSQLVAKSARHRLL